MPGPKSIISASCLCLLMTFCAASVKADTIYTYTGNQRTNISGPSCPPFRIGSQGPLFIDGSFTVSSPLGDNLNDAFVNSTSFEFSVTVDGVRFVNNNTNSFPNFSPQFDV